MPNQSIRVVRADLTAESSVALIEALNQELGALYPEPGANHFRLDPAEVSDGRGAFCVLADGDEKLGCGAVRLIDPETGELKRMYVKPTRRGEGLGRQLLAALEAEARALGARRLVLETGVRQQAARSLYEAAGFTPIPLYGEYCASAGTSVCLGKELPAPKLLNEDGSASIATLVLMSHHALRRDLTRFRAALERLARGEGDAGALREEWLSYRATLHGHHEAEDQRMFPHLHATEPALVPALERLTAEHRQIDPLLDRANAAFSALPAREPSQRVVAEVGALLDRHLAFEEATVVPYFRQVKAFPMPPERAELELMVLGFAWSCHGIATEVLDQVRLLLPEALWNRLPAARAAYDARVARAFGPQQRLQSLTAVPGS